MGYICITILIFIFICSLRSSKIIISPGPAFSFLFVFVFFLSLTGWFGMYNASDEAYCLITLGVLFYIIGVFIKKKYTYKNSFVNQGKITNQSEEFRKKRYIFMLIVCLAVLLISAINIAVFILSGGTMGDVYLVAAAATDGEENELSKGSMQVLLESYIAYPFLYLLVPVSLVEFFHTYKKKYLIVAIGLALLRVCLDARRTYLTAFILMTILCIYIHRKDYKYYSIEIKERFKKFKKYAIWIILFMGYFFVYMSQQRSIAKTGEDDSNTLRTLTQYYGASVQFFGDCIHTIKIDYTYGFSSFRGFLAPFFGVLRLFGIESPDLLDNANKYLSELHAHTLSISPEKDYNSFATCFFQFYCDGGLLGIIVLSFIYGYFSELFFEKMAITGSRCSESAYVFFFANILMLSFVNMETVLALNFWPLVLVNLLYTKSKNIVSYEKKERLD